ncbi:antibiotic transporter [Knoellia flava TL1]|uniref:MFS transporter n=2 Tax=Knoellia flava TaxID=913969 RepID=A0A8H9FVH4_9MICO|nr:antibiotic transporter [Knoellia flava TL1]GGB86270.1 MFS transporter [Knoellia flava]
MLAPSRLGRPFRWLMAASWTSNIGDGIALAAGPLLVASQTRNPTLVAMAALLQRLPWLLLGLWAGAIADRLDRERIIVTANTLRALVVVALCGFIVSDHVSIAVVLVTMCLYGVCEVFADSTAGTLLPMLVRRDDLRTGQVRLQAGFLTANQLVGPPIGAFLFAAGMAWPFVTQVLLVVLAIGLVARVDLPRGGVRGAVDTHVRADIREGLRWIRHHAAMRTLALVILTFNVTWGAAWSVLVLYSLDHLDMGEVGFGLLTTASAVGGVIATLSFDRISSRFSLALLMKVCLLAEVLTHLALALTSTGWVAIVIMFVFGAYAFTWGTVSNTVRQRAVPTAYQGRVGSVYMTGLFLGLVIGQAIGGPIAEQWGLTGPFWFAFAGTAVMLALVWRQLDSIAHAGDDDPDAEFCDESGVV